MPNRKDCHILLFCILHDFNVIYILVCITTCILVFYVILQRGMFILFSGLYQILFVFFFTFIVILFDMYYHKNVDIKLGA